MFDWDGAKAVAEVMLFWLCAFPVIVMILFSLMNLLCSWLERDL